MKAHSSVLRVARRLLLWIGIATLVYAGSTAAYAGIYQRYQSWRFQQTVAAAEVPAELPAELNEGDVVGKLEIPRIGISVMVLQGTEDGALAYGAGHVPGTPLPGAPGNVAIAAHRDTFFRNLKEIQAGDGIHFSTIHKTYDYLVESTETVDPNDTRVIESRDRTELTLITCFPFYFIGNAPRRFIVHARPTDISN